jgi:hypothetical protein
MTRAELIRKIAYFAEAPGPCSEPEEFDSYQLIDDWVAQAPDGWFDLLVDILAHPPDWAQYEKEHHLWMVEGWQRYQYRHLIGEGLAQDAERRVPMVGPLLNHADTRLIILGALAYVRAADSMPWLEPLVASAEDLEEPEQYALVKIVGAVRSDEIQSMLLRLKNAIPAPSARVQQAVNESLSRSFQ